MTQPFLGRGWKFPVAVDNATGKILMSEQEEDIAEAIRLILWTSKGERVMRPNFGCGLQDYVFDGTDPTTLGMLGNAVRQAIMVWESRVTDVNVQVRTANDEDGKLWIDVSYVVRTTNNLYNLVYPFYVQEGTK